MPYVWEQEKYEQLPAGVQRARALLEDWFRAIEDGSAVHRLPDPFYPVAIDQAAADRVVAALDEEISRELMWAKREDAGSHTAGPGFLRLGGPQRIALAQALHAIKAAHPVAPFPVYSWDGASYG